MQATETILSVIRDHPKLITGEPVTGKLVRRVREGADGKGPEPRAPRRRPTSLMRIFLGQSGTDLLRRPLLFQAFVHRVMKPGRGHQLVLLRSHRE